MLKFCGRKVPDHVYVHGFLTVSGEKMSKSRGTGISPLRYLELGMNPEWLRYYIAAKLNARVEDLDFNPDDFVARVNSDLVGKYVNIASRAAGFISKRFDGRLGRRRRRCTRGPARPTTLRRAAAEIAAALRGARVRQGDAPGDGARRPRQPLRDEQQAVGARQASRADAPRCTWSARLTLECFRLLTMYLKPVLPKLAERRRGVPRAAAPLAWGDVDAPLGAGHAIGRYEHLMQRVDPKQLDALFEPPSEAAPRRGRAPERRSP